MTKHSRRWRFNASMVRDAPDTAGLYALWEEDRLLVLGHARGGADTIRARLTAHLERCSAPAGGAPAAAPAAVPAVAPHPMPTHYSWEICLDPAWRQPALYAL